MIIMIIKFFKKLHILTTILILVTTIKREIESLLTQFSHFAILIFNVLLKNIRDFTEGID